MSDWEIRTVDPSTNGSRAVYERARCIFVRPKDKRNAFVGRVVTSRP